MIEIIFLKLREAYLNWQGGENLSVITAALEQYKGLIMFPEAVAKFRDYLHEEATNKSEHKQIKTRSHLFLDAYFSRTTGNFNKLLEIVNSYCATETNYVTKMKGTLEYLWQVTVSGVGYAAQHPLYTAGVLFMLFFVKTVKANNTSPAITTSDEVIEFSAGNITDSITVTFSDKLRLSNSEKSQLQIFFNKFMQEAREKSAQDAKDIYFVTRTNPEFRFVNETEFPTAISDPIGKYDPHVLKMRTPPIELVKEEYPEMIVHELHHASMHLQHESCDYPNSSTLRAAQSLPFDNETEFNELLNAINDDTANIMFNIPALNAKNVADTITDEELDLLESYNDIAEKFYKPHLQRLTYDENSFLKMKPLLDAKLARGEKMLMKGNVKVHGKEVSLPVYVQGYERRKNGKYNVIGHTVEDPATQKLSALILDSYFRMSMEQNYINLGYEGPGLLMEYDAKVHENGHKINEKFFPLREAYHQKREKAYQERCQTSAQL